MVCNKMKQHVLLKSVLLITVFLLSKSRLLVDQILKFPGILIINGVLSN